MPHRILARLTRSGLEESHHYGSYCVVARGRVVRSRGDLDAPVFYRSAAKPLQAIAVVESGAPDRFGFTDEELATCVGSHSGSPRHARNAASMIDKAGESPDLLRCGGHVPLSREVYEQYVRDGYRWGRLEDNCSGKHAGMIAAARAWGEPARTYADKDHKVQRRNLENIALFTGLQAEEIPVGIDGCAVPGCAVPLEAMARGMARFTTPDGVPGVKADAAGRILDVALRHPEMVGGVGRYDTCLIRAGGGRLLTKVGAEAVQVAGVVGRDVGIAVKIADGSWRALEAVMTALLVDLEVVARKDVADFLVRPVLTREGDKVGDLTVFLS